MNSELKPGLRTHFAGRWRMLIAGVLACSAVAMPAAGADAYSTLRIVEPLHESTVRDNSGNVNVAVELTPPLRAALGDRIVLRIDGNAVAQIEATQHLLSGVHRGTHALQAEVRSISGALVLVSEPVIFHVHQASRLTPGPGR